MTLPASYLMNTFAYHHWSIRLLLMLPLFLPFIITAINLWLYSPLLIPWSLIMLVPNLLLLFTVGFWKRAHYYGLFPLYEATGSPIEPTGFWAWLFKFFLLLIHPVVMVTDTTAITKSLGSIIIEDADRGTGTKIDGKTYYPGIVSEDLTRAAMTAGSKGGNAWNEMMEGLTKAATVIYGSAPAAEPEEEEEEAEEEEAVATSEMSKNPLAPILKQHREDILTAVVKTEAHRSALLGLLTEEHKKKIVAAVSDPYKDATTKALAAKTLPTEHPVDIMNDIIAKLSKEDQDKILLDIADKLLEQKNYKIIGDIANNLDETVRQEIIDSIPQEQQLAIMAEFSQKLAAHISEPTRPEVNDGLFWSYDGKELGKCTRVSESERGSQYDFEQGSIQVSESQQYEKFKSAPAGGIPVRKDE